MQELYFLGIPVVGIYCVTTTSPRGIAIVLVGGEIVQMPYDTYQAVRSILNLPDIICGENEIFPPSV